MAEDSTKDMVSTDLLTFKRFSEFASIKHFVSTRVSGFSPPPFDSLNLGLHVGDDADSVLKNRIRLASEVGIPPRNFTFAEQVHGTNIAVIRSEHRGSGAMDYETAIGSTDAMITNVPDICLTVVVADCVPILLFDPRQNVVAAVHAGWKGTAGDIASKTIRKMGEAFDSRPEDIVAGIGPSIGPCCYQVGSIEVEEFKETDEVVSGISDDGRAYLNLWEANRRQLLESGVEANNIEVAGVCTCCNSDKFFSHRKHAPTGRFAAGIMLVNEICASCTAIVCNWCSKE